MMWPLIRIQDAHFLSTMGNKCPMWITTSMAYMYPKLALLSQVMDHSDVDHNVFILGSFKTKVH